MEVWVQLGLDTRMDGIGDDPFFPEAGHKKLYHDSYRLSIVFWITDLAFERGSRKWKDLKGLGGG